VHVAAPASGRIAAANPELLREPSLAKSENYGSGCMFAIEPGNQGWKSLPVGEQARAWLRAEGDRLERFYETQIGLAAADGGELVAPPDTLLNDAQWKALAPQLPPDRGWIGRRKGAAGDDRGGRGLAAATSPPIEGDRMATRDRSVPTILARLRAKGSARNRAGMARYGIAVESAFGVPVLEPRSMARSLGRHHDLALALWKTGNHEARLLACFVDDPEAVTADQMESWAAGFDSWDVCDPATTSLFDRTRHAWTKAAAWAGREGEWVKRGGFALMAGLAAHDEAASDRAFRKRLPLVERGATDPRNFVKKGVSWALRNIGTRNRA
jgi:3-methyladenine DNA glycosylase AlkD